MPAPEVCDRRSFSGAGAASLHHQSAGLSTGESFRRGDRRGDSAPAAARGGVAVWQVLRHLSGFA